MKIFIDTDGGVDDAVSIAMAIHYLKPENILGIGTVSGNVSADQTRRNVELYVLFSSGVKS